MSREVAVDGGDVAVDDECGVDESESGVCEREEAA